VTAALGEVGIQGFTTSKVREYGAAKGRSVWYRDTLYSLEYSPKLKMEIVVADNESEYLNRASRARNISVTELVHRVLKTVVQDRMLLGILDDGVSEIAAAPKLSLPKAPPRVERVPIEERCRILVKKIRQRGSLRRIDLGSVDESAKWQAAITKLVVDNVIRAEDSSRPLRYVLVRQLEKLTA